MTMPGVGRVRVLVQTVGTGNLDDLENTLIKPMLKSIQDGEWQRVVLLPSRFSETWARQIRKRVPDAAVEIRPLSKTDSENDADACFEHFDKVLGELIANGFAPNQIIPDFTRGTKAMSAAFVLAAVRRDIPVVRYVHSQHRNQRGTAVSGTEIVGQFQMTKVSVRRRLDLAVELMRCGDFGAVLTLVPDMNGPFADLYPEDIRCESEGLCAAASLYAAWDCLDYLSAAKAINRCSVLISRIPQEFRPSDDMRTLLRQLAAQPDRADIQRYAAWLRAVACDLLANAERRVRDRHFEDALIRSYRIPELVGQFRLFDKGYDSSALCPKDNHVRKLCEELKKQKRDFRLDRKTKRLQASRENAAHLLKFLQDPFGKRLINLDRNRSSVKAAARNNSILIHGFEARAPSGEKLKAYFKRLQELLLCDDPKAEQRLETARRLNFQTAC